MVTEPIADNLPDHIHELTLHITRAKISRQTGSRGKNGSTSPGATLKQNVLDHESDIHAAKVKTMMLDDYFDKAAIALVDFVKVDVEGSELDLLEGALQTLKNHNASWVIESQASHQL